MKKGAGQVDRWTGGQATADSLNQHFARLNNLQ